MAVDEVLWRSCDESGQCCWRFYQWNEPTLSLGHFQADEDRRRHAASQRCPVVRRLSGGGAIVHDIELTYSLAIPSTHPLAARRQPLYLAIHATLIEALAELGIAASLRGEPAVADAAPRPFLCFQRESAGDVLFGAVKIAGSAQRRSRGAVLQHGSILLGRSAAAPELAGLRELASATLRSDQIVDTWLKRLARQLDWNWREMSLTVEEKQRVADLAAAKYAASPSVGQVREDKSPESL